MSTTLTPPPVVPPTSPPDTDGGDGGATRPASRVVAIVAIVCGGLVAVGALGSAALGAAAAASVRTEVRTTAATGVDDLDVDVSAGSLTVEFTDVAQAELEVTGAGGASGWTLERDGSELVVASPDGLFTGGWPFGRAGTAVLRLPEALRGSDADFTLAAGSLSADGAFGELSLDLGAGRASLAGSVDDLDVDVNAGAADLDLADVRHAVFSVSAGAVSGRLTGTQPDTLAIDVSAGGLRLTIPDGDYDVTSDVSAGEFRTDLSSTPGASSKIRVDVSAGEAVLRTR